MACLSDESWVSLPKMLSERLSLRGDRDEEENKRFVDSKITQYRLEKVFPVYAMGISRPDSDSVVSVGNLGDAVSDPIWDAVTEEAKLEVHTTTPIFL
jgi:serine O-acetyltransferase